MAITRYAGDRFVGLDEEKNSLLSKVMDGAFYIATDLDKQYLKKDGSWVEVGVGIDGSGISGYLPLWLDEDTIGNSLIYQSGANIGINTINPEHALHISGDAQISGYLYDYTNSTGLDGYVLTSRSGGPVWEEIQAGGGTISGSGVSGYVARWDGETNLTSGVIYDNGTSVGIGTTTLAEALTVNGRVEAEEFIGDLRGAVVFKANAGENISKGQAVYISGISGNKTVVSLADADDASKMPAFGVAAETVSANSDITIVTFGRINNLNTSAYTEGDELFVSTTAGALTDTPPAGESALLQKLTKVTRSDNSAGSMTVMGAGRTNAVPNLNKGRLFVGNASNQPVADGTVYVDIANSKVGINTTSPQHNLHVSGNAIISGYLYDSTNSTGAVGYVLTSENNGPQWKLIEDVLSGVGGSGTANYVPLWQDEDTLTDSVIYQDGANIGIGTASPSNQLTLYRTSGDYFPVSLQAHDIGTSGTYLGLQFGYAGGTYQKGAIIYESQDAYARGKMHFALDNGANAANAEIADSIMALVSDGKVGIGVTDPGSRLDVKGDIRVRDTDSDSNHVYLFSNSTEGVLRLSNGSNYGFIARGQGNNPFIGTHTSGALNISGFTNSLGASIGFTLAQFDFSTQRVGIGLQSPSEKLEVQQNGNYQLKLTNASTGGGNVRIAYADNAFGSGGSKVVFDLDNGGSANAELVIQSDGNIGIGATSPVSRLNVVGSTANTSVFRVEGTSGTLFDITDTLTGSLFSVSDSSGLPIVEVFDNDRVIMGRYNQNDFYLDSTGNLGLGTASPVSQLHISSASTSALTIENTTNAGNASLNFRDEGGTDQFKVFYDLPNNKAWNYVNGNGLTIYSTQSSAEIVRFGLGGGNTYIDSLFNGNVGIGVTPATKLHVNGLTTLGAAGKTEGGAVVNFASFGEVKSGAQTLLGNAVVPGTANNTIQHSKSDAGNFMRMVYSKGISFHTNITGAVNTDVDIETNERVRIDLDGKVGIGTTTPVHQLHVSGDAIISGYLYDSTNSTGIAGYVLTSEVGGPQWQSIEDVLSGVGGSGVVDYVARWQDEDTLTTGILYDNGSNVGVGTNSPTSLLHLRNPNADSDVGIKIGNDVRDWNLKVMGSVSDSFQIFTHDDSNVFTILSDGKVGINTTTPTSLLHVHDGDILISNGDLQFYPDSSGAGSQFDYYAGKLFIGNQAGSSWHMVIQDDGNIGVGTTSPTSTLNIYDGTSGSSVLKVDGTNGTLFEVVDDLSGSLMSVNDAAGLPVLEVFADSHIVAGRYGQNDFYLDTNGNLGLGTASPNQKLEVFGNQRISNNGVLEFFGGVIYPQISRNGVSGGLIIDTAGGGVSNSVPLLSVRENGGADFVTVLGSGYVGIGTGSPDGLLHLNASSQVSHILTTTLDAGTGPQIRFEHFRTNGLTGFGDDLGTLDFVFQDSAGNEDVGARIFAALGGNSGDNTDGQERSRFKIQTLKGSSTLSESIEITRDGNILLSNGSVGIGITPSALLHVNGYSLFAGLVDIFNSNALFGPRLRVGRNSAENIRFEVDDLDVKITADQDETNLNHNFILNRTFGPTTGESNFVIQSEGSTQLLVNKDGNLGIGTPSPQHDLHVEGDAIISGYLYDSTNSTGVAGYVLTSEAGGPQWQSIEDVLSGVGGGGTTNYIPKWDDTDTLGNSNIYEDSSGNIGIDTASPVTKLHVSASASGDAANLLLTNTHDTNGDTASIQFSMTDTALYNKAAIYFERTDLQGEGSLHLATSNTGNSTSVTKSDARLTITKDGNVGIGTTAPVAGLDVNNGAGYFTSFNNPTGSGRTGLEIGYTSGSSTSIIQSYNRVSSSYVPILYNASTHSFGVGNVGIGTASPSQLLNLTSANGAGTSTLISNTARSGYAHAIFTAYVSDSNASRVGFGNNAYPSAQYTFAVSRLDTNRSAWAWSSYALKSTYENQSAMTLQYVSAGGTQSEALRVNADGNLGIGTISPVSKLNVVGSTANASVFRVEGTSGTLFDITDTLTGSLFSVSDSSGLPIVEVFDNDRVIMGRYNQNDFYLDTTGNVGLGTASPWEKLTVYGGGINFGSAPNVNNSAKLTYNSTSGQLKISAHSTGGNTYQTFTISDAGSQIDALTILNGGNIQLNTYGSGNNTGTATQKLAVDSSGNVIEIDEEKYLTSTGGTIDTGFTADNFRMLEVVGHVNPNNAGSAAYRDPVHIYVYNGVGWNGSAVTNYVYSTQIAPIAREAFTTGSSNSGNIIEAVFLTGSTESDSCPNSSASSYQVRLKISNYNTDSYFQVKVIKRF